MNPASDPGDRAYLDLHRPRYAILIEALGRCLADAGRPRGAVRILDVGPAPQTGLIRQAFPAARIDTLGFANPQAAAREGERHVAFDLNEAPQRGRWPDLGPYDAIVFAEVLEHLTTAPRAVFECMAAWLDPAGVLIVQTPNALALHKRLRALAGRNPLGAGGAVTARANSPAHFREYTLDEVVELGRAAGLEPAGAQVRNHFRHPRLAHRAYDRLTEALPAGTRQGITICLRRPRA
jgi:trans-aconitate methyltransferase